jgi:hypothetical protein
VVVAADGEDSSATGVIHPGPTVATSNNLTLNSGAVYVFVRNGTTWSQQAYLKASNTGRHDHFGVVSVSGDTVVVGVPNEDSDATGVVHPGPTLATSNDLAPNAGAAYVFVRNGTTWTQQAYLKASNTEASDLFLNDQFGTSLSVSGNTVVVGAPAEDSNATGVNPPPPAQNNNNATDSGAAYVFVKNTFQ